MEKVGDTLFSLLGYLKVEFQKPEKSGKTWVSQDSGTFFRPVKLHF
jgi:hypothetical protein